VARIKPRTVALDHVWLRPGYFRWKVRRIIRRIGAIAVRNLSSAAGRCMRAGAFVTSDGIGGAVPLRDGRGRVVVVLGWGAAGSCMAFSFRRWRQMPKSSSAPRGESPAGGAGGGGLGALTDAHRSRRQVQTGVPRRFSDHLARRQAPPGASQLNRLRRARRCPAFSCQARNLAWQLPPGTGKVSRTRGTASVMSTAIMTTRPLRMNSSGSRRGRWPPSAADTRCLASGYAGKLKLAMTFQNLLA
jgi:hypothetical protein